MTAKTARPTIGYTAAGFPLVTCTRCGGTGHYSYNAIDGSRCYGCSGEGKVIRPGAAAKAAAAYAEALRGEKEATITGTTGRRALAVGDKVNGRLAYRNAKGDKWATVKSIEIHDDEISGRSLRAGEMVPSAWYATVVLEHHDGTTTTHRTATNAVIRRFAKLGSGPFLAEAGLTMPTEEERAAAEAGAGK